MEGGLQRDSNLGVLSCPEGGSNRLHPVSNKLKTKTWSRGRALQKTARYGERVVAVRSFCLCSPFLKSPSLLEGYLCLLLNSSDTRGLPCWFHSSFRPTAKWSPTAWQPVAHRGSSSDPSPKVSYYAAWRTPPAHSSTASIMPFLSLPDDPPPPPRPSSNNRNRQ